MPLYDDVLATMRLLKSARGRAGFDILRAAQIKKMTNVISGTVISTEILEQVWPLFEMSDTGLSASEMEALQTAIALKASEIPAGGCGDKIRKAVQNFGCFTNYFTAEHWAYLKDEPDPLLTLCDAIIALGGRNMSEQTFQKLTALLLLLQNKGKHKLCLAMTPLAKNETLRHVKRVFRARCSKASPQTITALPESPSTLLEERPDLYNAWLGDDMPIPCPYGTDVESLACTVKMRICSGSNVSTTSTAQSGNGAVLPSESSQMMMLMQHFFQKCMGGGGHGPEQLSIDYLTPSTSKLTSAFTSPAGSPLQSPREQELQQHHLQWQLQQKLGQREQEEKQQQQQQEEQQSDIVEQPGWFRVVSPGIELNP